MLLFWSVLFYGTKVDKNFIINPLYIRGHDDNLSVLDDFPDLRQETPSQEEEEEEEEPGEDLEEVEEGEENLLVPTQPKFEPCPEDDDFLAALDKMVNENIAESKNLGRTRVLSDPHND